VIALITNWLRDGKNKSWLLPEHTRLLNDLLQAMRMRRRLAFSGYSTIGHETVLAPRSGIFCTDLFGGFLANALVTAYSGDGVLTGITERFQGFLNNALLVSKESEAFLVSSSFDGFLVDAPICSPEITMVL